MPKNKESYLPVEWCKRAKTQMSQVLATTDIDPFELFAISDKTCSPEKKQQVLDKYPKLKQAITQAYLLTSTYKSSQDAIIKEIVSDMDSMSLLMAWSQNKQAFKIDKDFSNELIRTKNLKITKNAWDYLPYRIFYVDISDNKELCKTVCGEGFVMRTEKSEDEEVWFLHVSKLTDKFFFSDIIQVPNTDESIDIEDIQQQTSVDLIDFDENKDHIKLNQSKTKIDTRVFMILVIQILTYLSSIEPDINENENTKRTYRKPTNRSKPKDKFSEVQAWDVGIRFGSAYRKWKKQQNTADIAVTSEKPGSRKRPHIRQAHWHHFWYGPQNGKRVLRPKWIQETFVNAVKSEDMPVTMHKTEGT